MKYAIIADIHANIHALDAVLAHIDTKPVGTIYHLGDLVGYAPWPNEVVARLRERGIQGISGNYDSTVATDYRHCGCKYEDPAQEASSHVSYEWTRAHVSPGTKAYLGSLPFRIDVRQPGGHVAGPTLILVHGTPLNNVTYWTEDRPDSFCTKMAEAAGARAGDLIAFGHTHKPWHRVVEGVHFVNAGSVGRPKDGDWRAGYVIIDLSEQKAEVEFIRVEYDVAAAMHGIEQSGLPSAFAAHLKNGGA